MKERYWATIISDDNGFKACVNMDNVIYITPHNTDVREGTRITFVNNETLDFCLPFEEFLKRVSLK